MVKNRKIIEISSVDSTNNYALNLLKNQNLEEGTIILANTQEEGRGQRGNTWHSASGKNITCSIVVQPTFLPIENQFYLSILVSLSIIDLLKKIIDGFCIKWPNDIYYRDSKIAGILVENTIFGSMIKNSVIGVGLNINQKEFPAELPNPISLNNITDKEYDLLNIVEELANCFEKNYKELQQKNYTQLKEKYYKNLYLFKEMRKFKDANGEFEGKIINVLDSGELIILDESMKKRSYMFKEVEFLPQ